MLQFFRKHQRVFFLFTTIVIIISFTFFGTFSTFNNGKEEKDIEIAKALDGSSIMKRQVARLSAFLSSSYEDGFAEERGRLVNLFNDGVLEKDFLANGLGDMLAERFFEELKPFVEERMQRASRYRSYVHPSAPFINMESVWGHFSPSLSETVSLLKRRKNQADMESFSLLGQAYLQQKKVPPSLVRKILYYQERQVEGIEHDPELAYTDLSVFGFHSLEDWLSPKYVELASQFILNAAIEAKSRGYRVSREETKKSLLENMSSALKQLSNESVSSTDVQQGYYRQLQMLAIDESSCIELWQNVLLFRRLFEETGHSVMIDPLMNQEFHTFANESANIAIYELPKALQLVDFRSMLKLQTYLEGVFPKAKTSLSLPSDVLSVSEVEKRAPELVKKNYTLEFGEVNKKDLLLQIPLKDTWDWELSDAGWELLQKNFSLLEGVYPKRQERFEALARLEERQRAEVDAFAREQIMKHHPEWLQEALQRAPRVTKSLAICCKGGALPFRGVSQNLNLMGLLDKAPLKGESSPSIEAITTQQKLSKFSEDGEHYYTISVLSRDFSRQVLSFQEAKNLGVLDAMLDKRLEDAYLDARKKDLTYQNRDGSWKSLSEVRDQVGAHVFSDLLKTIEQAYAEETGKYPSQEQKRDLKFYATYRLLPFFKEALSSLSLQDGDERWVVASEKELSGASKQWRLIRSEQEASRSMKDIFQNEALFQMAEGGWSPVLASTSGRLMFFQMLKRAQTSPLRFEEVKKTQAMLSLEVQRELMQHLLDRIEAKRSISLTKDN